LSASEFFSFSLSFYFLANFRAALNFLVLFVSRQKEQEIIQENVSKFLQLRHLLNQIIGFGLVKMALRKIKWKALTNLKVDM
jgi:hypothetical protein